MVLRLISVAAFIALLEIQMDIMMIGACARRSVWFPFIAGANTMERTIKPNTLKTELLGKLILDVRRAADREAAPEHLPGAQWKNPEQLAEWADSLPKNQDIVLYCARGGSVSNSVVDALQAKGLKARFIEGGIEGWKAAGGGVVGK
jgi:rhodanese-related sulfurtransferase